MNTISMTDFLQSITAKTKSIKQYLFFLNRIANRNKRPDKIHWPDSLECGMLTMHNAYKTLHSNRNPYEIVDFTNTKIKYTGMTVLGWGDRQLGRKVPTTECPIQFRIYDEKFGEWRNHYKSFADAKDALNKISSNYKNNNILKEMGFVYSS